MGMTILRDPGGHTLGRDSCPPTTCEVVRYKSSLPFELSQNMRFPVHAKTTCSKHLGDDSPGSQATHFPISEPCGAASFHHGLSC